MPEYADVVSSLKTAYGSAATTKRHSPPKAEWKLAEREAFLDSASANVISFRKGELASMPIAELLPDKYQR
jgi:hypothetical protein